MTKHFPTNRPLTRRSLLRAAGVSLTLPFLDAMVPAFAKERVDTQPPRRMVSIMTDLGMLPENFFPREVGREYQASKYLTILDAMRDKYTVFSGLFFLGEDRRTQMAIMAENIKVFRARIENERVPAKAAPKPFHRRAL